MTGLVMNWVQTTVKSSLTGYQIGVCDRVMVDTYTIIALYGMYKELYTS